MAFPSPGYLPDPGIEPRSPTLQADALPSEPPGSPNKGLSKSIQACDVPVNAVLNEMLEYCDWVQGTQSSFTMLYNDLECLIKVLASALQG